jgi:hypothetical protein
MSIIYGVDKDGKFSSNNYECFQASLNGSQMYLIGEGSTALVMRVDFKEENSRFSELLINEKGDITTRPVKSLVLKLGKASIRKTFGEPIKEYIELGKRDMDIVIYDTKMFEKECKLQDEIFKKSFQYSFDNFRLPKSICPSVILGGLFDSINLEFLLQHIESDERDFFKRFFAFKEDLYVNTVLLMPLIEDSKQLHDFVIAFFKENFITQEKYVNVISNFLFNIFILHAIEYRHNDLQNTNLLTFGCNFNTIDRCKYYIIDFGLSRIHPTKKNASNAGSIITRMRSEPPNHSLLNDYKKYLNEDHVLQYFTEYLEPEILKQTKLLFEVRPISEEIMENNVIKDILSKELELVKKIPERQANPPLENSSMTLTLPSKDNQSMSLAMPSQDNQPSLSLKLPPLSIAMPSQTNEPPLSQENLPALSLKQPPLSIAIPSDENQTPSQKKPPVLSLFLPGGKTKKHFKKRNRKTNRIRKTKRSIKQIAKKTKKRTK